MLFWWGGRSCGRIYDCGNDLVSTIFFHIWFVPLFPVCGTLVAKKGFIKDEGEEIPINLKSVFAGYMRHILFAIACAGFAMAFDGLFLVPHLNESSLSTIKTGTIIYAIGSTLWLWSMFVLGAKQIDDSIIGFSLTKFTAGLFAAVAIMGLMHVVGHNIPRKLSQEKFMQVIIDNKTLTDEQAVYKIAREILSDGDQLEVKQTENGIVIYFVKLFDSKTTTLHSNQQGQLSPNEMKKIYTMLQLCMKIQKITKYGQHRNLSRIIASATMKLPDEKNQLVEFETFRVNIPKNKFDNMIAVSPFLFVQNKDLDFFKNLGVVETDNFHLMTFEKIK